MQVFGLFDCLNSIPCFSTDTPVWLGLYERAQRAAKQLMVIGNQNLDGAHFLLNPFTKQDRSLRIVTHNQLGFGNKENTCEAIVHYPRALGRFDVQCFL
jgi:hypothetical protein